MKVSELIDFLETQDPEAMVVVSALEGGVNECQTAIGIKVLINYNEKHWSPGRGLHEITYRDINKLYTNEIRGVLIQ